MAPVIVGIIGGSALGDAFELEDEQGLRVRRRGPGTLLDEEDEGRGERPVATGPKSPPAEASALLDLEHEGRTDGPSG